MNAPLFEKPGRWTDWASEGKKPCDGAVQVRWRDGSVSRLRPARTVVWDGVVEWRQFVPDPNYFDERWLIRGSGSYRWARWWRGGVVIDAEIGRPVWRYERFGARPARIVCYLLCRFRNLKWWVRQILFYVRGRR